MEESNWRETYIGDSKIACKYCGELTSMIGTKLYDNCWEMEMKMSKDIVLAEKILESLKKKLR